MQSIITFIVSWTIIVTSTRPAQNEFGIIDSESSLVLTIDSVRMQKPFDNSDSAYLFYEKAIITEGVYNATIDSIETNM